MSAVFWRLLEQASSARRLSMETPSLTVRAQLLKFARACDEKAGVLVLLELKSIAMASATASRTRSARRAI